MAFYVKQYSQNKGGKNWCENVFSDASAYKVEYYSVTPSEAQQSLGDFELYDPSVISSSNDKIFKDNVNYYLHAKVKVMSSLQDFNIQLISDDSTTSTGQVTQFLKRLRVAGGNDSSWVDVDLCFTPCQDFERLVFTLVRNNYDYQAEGSARLAVVEFLELKKLTNMVSQLAPTEGNVKEAYITKFGLRANPGLKFNIDGGMAQVGVGGVYEFSSDTISIDQLSIFEAADFSDTATIKEQNQINLYYESLLTLRDKYRTTGSSEQQARPLYYALNTKEKTTNKTYAELILKDYITDTTHTATPNAFLLDYILETVTE